ncbi:hypothetical protein Tco_1121379 [Tanacetum coccineum]|uniref:Uncharacterized protein n=1 Tax=Tanacetum coccineum TaxID=301880 RepID=A0ABQ5J178_9ASTR
MVKNKASRRLNEIGSATVGGDGSGGGEGVLKAKSSGVIGENNGDELRLEAIEEEEDVPLADEVLNGALGSFGDMGLCISDGVLASSWDLEGVFDVEFMKKRRFKFSVLGTKKQQTYKLIIGSIDVNAARYVLVPPMAVNTASLIFEEDEDFCQEYCPYIFTTARVLSAASFENSSNPTVVT